MERTMDTMAMAEWRIKALKNDSIPGSLWRGDDDIPFIENGAMLAEHDAKCMDEERPFDCWQCCHSLPVGVDTEDDYRAYVADMLAKGGIDHD